jgi:acyl-coenzyme A thioesterase PaaI-like protein
VGSWPGRRPPGYYERVVDSHADRAATFADYLNETPFGGGTHPISPPGSVTLNPDGSVTGLVTAGRPYEGPARCMHGGFVAGLFDHFLGMSQHAYNQANGTNVMGATRELTVRFKKPTPLDTELTFRAWLEDVDERTLRGHATCHAGDVLTASAECEFVKLGVERILSTDPDGFNAPRPSA